MSQHEPTQGEPIRELERPAVAAADGVAPTGPPCCSPATQLSCCEPADKGACCGPAKTASGGCGCQP